MHPWADLKMTLHGDIDLQNDIGQWPWLCNNLQPLPTIMFVTSPPSWWVYILLSLHPKTCSTLTVFAIYNKSILILDQLIFIIASMQIHSYLSQQIKLTLIYLPTKSEVDQPIHFHLTINFFFKWHFAHTYIIHPSICHRHRAHFIVPLGQLNLRLTSPISFCNKGTTPSVMLVTRGTNLSWCLPCRCASLQNCDIQCVYAWTAAKAWAWLK